jgi:hypothetical protein
MKTKVLTMILFAMLTLANSCTKTGSILPGNETDELKSSLGGIQTFLVEPEGPMYDTQNLLEAFAMAESGGAGSIIRLAEGIFYYDKLDIFNFNGILCGAGKSRTIIRTVPGGISLPVETPFIETNPFFFNFHGGDFTVRDISFDISEDNPVKPYDWWTGGNVTFLCAVMRISGSSKENYNANAVLENLSFSGREVNLSEFTPYNIDNCILLGGGYETCSLGGNFTVQNCDFNRAETGVNSLGLSDATLTVGGSSGKGNKMQALNAGIYFCSGDKVNARISHNLMTGIIAYSGIEIGQNNIPSDFNFNVEPSRCTFLIYDNHIELGGEYSNGIVFYDIVGLNDKSRQSKAVIRNNTITLNKDDQAAIVGYCAFSSEVIRNNIFGQSVFAVLLYGVSSGCKLIFNNFDDYETTFTDILLYTETFDNLVVCETAATSVYDASGLNTINGPAERGKVKEMDQYLSLIKNLPGKK